MGFLTTSRRVSFGAVEFPWQRFTIESAQRVGIHEYAYLDGAELEKLARKPYQFTFSCIFDENLEQEYPGAVRRILPAMQRMFEQRTSDTLVMPRFGQIQAFFSKYREEGDSMTSSGVTATFEFIEENGLTIGDIVAPAVGFDQIPADMTLVLAYRAELAARGIAAPEDDWTKLQSSIDSLMAIKDRGELYASKAEQRLLSVDRAIRKLDTFYSQPVGYRLIDSLRVLWVDTQKLVKDSTLVSRKTLLWRTERRMTIGQLSILLYNDTSRSVELMQLNELSKPFAISPGTLIRYYEPTLKVAA